MNGYDISSLHIQSRGQNRRVSSFDPTGGNHDWRDLPPGATLTVADIQGCGIIRHIWCTHWTGDKDWVEEPLALRKLVLRMYWDGETEPSVQAPLGDFFGMPFARRMNFSSEAFSMAPEDGRGMNCWWPMPFRRGARVTVESLCEQSTNFYFYIDYEAYDELPQDADTGYFHAQFLRERDTQGWAPEEIGLLDRVKANVPEEPAWVPEAWLRKNTDGEGNYVILEAEGRGRYVGCNMGVDIFRPQANQWYGEGDDMIFIDGEPWPPKLHGTGTEDYFCTAFGPTQQYTAPFNGITLGEGTVEKEGYKYHGKNAMYRLHIRDPIQFERSIRVTIEHGHANKLTGDWCSTAYWYQTEPHRPMAPLPGLGGLLPRPDNREDQTLKYRGVIFDLDGVLCHTDKFHYLAWKEIADELGIYFDETINHRLRGVSRRQSFEIILERCDRTLSEAEIQDCLDRKNNRYVEFLQTMSPTDLDGGVLSTLKALRAAGVKLAIGSSSRNTPIILERLGIGGYFDAVSDGNNIQHSKPHPQVFSMAAQFLALTPRDCLVVEDAVAGLEAARAAGMDAAAIGDEAVGSGLAVHNLTTLADLLKATGLSE